MWQFRQGRYFLKKRVAVAGVGDASLQKTEWEKGKLPYGDTQIQVLSGFTNLFPLCRRGKEVQTSPCQILQ